MSHTTAEGERRRRWYDLRPKPRRSTDVAGFNATWTMALAWIIVILAVVVPFPWW